MADTGTNPGDRSVAELEREVDRERARVAETIDALQAKASVGNLLDEVVRLVRENGGDMSRNLGRAVRDNPLPALLTGVGLAWLMAGSGRPSERDYGRGYAPFPVGDRTGGMGERSGWENDPYAAGPDAAGEYGAGIDALGEAGEEPGLRERASEAAAGLGKRASGVAHAAREGLSGAGHAMQRAGHAVQDVGHYASGQAGRARRGLTHAGSDARDAFERLIDEQPLVVGALALAFGAAIGGALPSSRAEDRLFGARADQAKRALREVAGEEARKVKATAEAVAREAGAIAEETSAELREKLPEGATLADAAAERVKEAANRMRDAGMAEAERQDLGHGKSE